MLPHRQNVNREYAEAAPKFPHGGVQRLFFQLFLRRDSSRAAKVAKSTRALAPEGMLERNKDLFRGSLG
jgi:hypothetical protein